MQAAEEGAEDSPGVEDGEAVVEGGEGATTTTLGGGTGAGLCGAATPEAGLGTLEWKNHSTMPGAGRASTGDADVYRTLSGRGDAAAPWVSSHSRTVSRDGGAPARLRHAMLEFYLGHSVQGQCRPHDHTV